MRETEGEGEKSELNTFGLLLRNSPPVGRNCLTFRLHVEL